MKIFTVGRLLGVQPTLFDVKFTQPLFFRISVYRDCESGRPTHKFEQHLPRVLPEMPGRWLPTLVITVFCRVLVSNSAVPYKNNVSERKITSFYEVTVKTYTKTEFVMSH